MPIPPQLIARKTISYEKLKENTIMWEENIALFAGKMSIAIDSTGTKYESGRITVSDEMIRHLKSAYLRFSIRDFGATDAVVTISVEDMDSGTTLVSISTSSDTHEGLSADIVNALKSSKGNKIYIKVEVSTASGTAGATANIYYLGLKLIYGVS